MSEAKPDQIPEAALAWHRAGKPAALATVVDTWGSAPRPVGSQLAISGDAGMVGSVSGGCVEGAVVAEALDALQDGSCRVLTYGVSDEDAFAVGLACGGTIRVLVEPIGLGQGIPGALLERLVAARAARTAIVYAVDPETFERHLISPPLSSAPKGSTAARSPTAPRSRPDADPPAGLIEAAGSVRHADRSGYSGTWFLGVHNPPLRLFVIGAVHIAQALLPMARIAGYDASLIDPRAAFAADARFPGETLLQDWPDAALQAHGLDARTAVVTLTHDPKLDDPAIAVALRSEVFYLGCLGSTRTHAKRVARLAEAGFTPDEIARIHAPVGADIGAKSPAEIAVSILAQITERLRRPETRPDAARQAA
ncbi:MAG: XdhC family protein [Pseudomonadota bacterium]